MEFADQRKVNAGGVRVIAVAYFFGTIMSLLLLSALGVPMPTMPSDASRDQIVILGFAGALALAVALYPLARGVGGSRLRRLLTVFAFTYVAFAVINQLQAAVFSTLGGSGQLLAFHAIPCLLAAGAAAWLVQPADKASACCTVFQDRPMSAWWWRPLVVLLALPCIEAVTGVTARPVLEEVIRQQPTGLHAPGGAVVMATMLLKSGLLLAVTVPVVLSWQRSRRHLMLALATAILILTGLVGLLQAPWWPVSLRLVFSLQILVTSITYAAVVVLLFVPKGKKLAAELETSNQ